LAPPDGLVAGVFFGFLAEPLGVLSGISDSLS
jgi:hypothetical protein